MSCKTTAPTTTDALSSMPGEAVKDTQRATSPCQTAVKLAQERAKNRQLLALLESARQALGTCRFYYSEYNQLEGDWTADFNEAQVAEALASIHKELGLPAPAPIRKS